MYKFNDFWMRWNYNLKIKRSKLAIIKIKQPRQFCRIKKFYFLIFLLFILFVMCIYVINSVINPILIELVSANANHKLNIIVDRTIIKTMEQNNIFKNSFYDLVYDNNGKVASSSVNMICLSKFKSLLTLNLQEELLSVEECDVSIPVGRITGIEWLFDWGPSIKIKLISVGGISVDFRNCCQSLGINQTKHEIQLIISSDYSILLPNMRKRMKMRTTVPITEAIIVGQVPITRTNTNGFVPDV